MTAPGTLVAGRYRLVRSVGAGGMGSVWEGWDELLQRRVAVKQLLPQPGLSVADAATARDRVIREARITARLHHPNAVTLYDVVGHDGRPCLIMQFVPSVTLSSLVQVEGPIQPQFAARIGAELASALGAAHAVGIIHRDVKPSNVLITDDSSAKLTDFGISRAIGDASLTSTGMVTGTPAFLAPEVARGAAAGFPADVFSLGATLYAAMEGGPPSGTDSNPMAVLHRVASGHLIPPARTGRLTPLVLQMLAYEPADRPTIAEIIETLTRLDREFAGAGPVPQQSAVPLPATELLPIIRSTPPVAATSAGPPTALETAAAGPPTGTGPGSTGRRKRFGVLPVAAFVVVLIATVVISVLLVTNRNGTGQAAPSTDASTTSGARASTSGSSATPRTSGVAGAPPVPASTTSARSGTSAPATTASATGAGSSPSTTAIRSSRTAASSTAPSSTAPSNSVPSRSVPSSTVPSSTVPSSTVPSSTVPSSTAPSSAAGTPSSTELARAVTDYYALLPGDTDAAWERLTPRFQRTTAVDRQYYERFWDGITRVTIRGAEGSAPDTAGAEITYYFEDGRVAVEATLFTLVRDGDGLDIDTSTVLTSEVS